MIARYTLFVIRYRWAVIVLMALVTVVLAAKTGSLTTDVREDAALPRNHPFVQLDREIHRLFRGHKMLVIGLTVSDGTVYTPATLGKIVRITRGLEDLPGVVDEALFSLASTRVKNIKATADGIDVQPFLVTVPADEGALARLRADVAAHPLYVDYLVSADGRSAAIFADFRNEANDVDIQERVEAIVAPERDAGTAIRLGGVPIVMAQVNRYTARMAILFPCAVLLIAVVHYRAFRTVQAMILPLVTALVSVIWALGIIASLGYPLDTWSAITPVLILAIAAGHAVQILKRYYEEFARLHDSHAAIVAALTKVGPVMIIAGSIAAAGFASLTTFDVPSVRVFGMLLTAGILSALLIELTLIPAFRAVLPAPREREAAAEARGDRMDEPLRRLAARTSESPRAVVAVTLAITLLLALGVARLHIDNSVKAWFGADTDIRRDDAALNAALAGTSTFKVLVSGAEPDAVLDPTVMRAIDDLARELERIPGVGKAVSFVDQLKMVNQAAHDDDPKEFAVPPDRERAAQYLLFYGPQDLAALLDDDRRHALVLAVARSDAASFGAGLVAHTQAFVARRFAGLPVTVGIAGGSLGVQTAMNSILVREKLRNIVQVGVIIFVLASLVLRSAVGGMLVLVPLLVAVLANLGVMGWSGIWLSMGTAPVPAMAVSIGADFAVYFLFRLREELALAGDVHTALERTLLTAGKAVLFVSSAVAIGYAVLALAGFALWTYLGMLTASMVGFAALATITMVPALALWLRPRFIFQRGDLSPRSIEQSPMEPHSPAR